MPDTPQSDHDAQRGLVHCQGQHVSGEVRARIAGLAALLCVATAHAQAPSRLEELLRADVGRASDDPDQTCADILQPPERYALVILGSHTHLASAEATAREISRRTGIRYSDEGYFSDGTTKHALYNRQHDGAYVPRWRECRESTTCITVELSSGYDQLTPNMYIVVGAAGLEATRDALAQYRKVVRDSYLKRSTLADDKGLYGGVGSACSQSDVLVLARTKLYDEAVAIAREVATRTGVRYDARRPNPASWPPAEREPPFPNISVERDNAYGSAGDGAYFLVVGGEFNGSESAPETLLERFKLLVPRAYRMKRADPACGL